MQKICHNRCVAARSPQREGAEAFTAPARVNQRRYEALRAYYVDGLSYQQAGERFGYTRWSMINLVREHKAGKLELFAQPRKPGPAPGTAPARERVRGRVIGLRRQGLSSYEISARLAGEGTPLNRTSVAEILAEEGFGRLLRRPWWGRPMLCGSARGGAPGHGPAFGNGQPARGQRGKQGLVAFQLTDWICQSGLAGRLRRHRTGGRQHGHRLASRGIRCRQSDPGSHRDGRDRCCRDRRESEFGRFAIQIA